MTDVESRLADIEAHDYEVVGHLTLPDEGMVDSLLHPPGEEALCAAGPIRQRPGRG